MSSNMDVSLRLRLDYQKRNAEQAERDLKDIKAAADRIGKSNGADELAADLKGIGRSADEARQKIGTIGNGFQGLKSDAREAVAAIGNIKAEANEARAAIGRIDDGAFSGLKTDAREAVTAIGTIKAEANEAKAVLGRIDDGAFAGLKGDAEAAKRAVAEIGSAADTAHEKLKQMRGYTAMTTPGGRLVADGSWRSPGTIGSVAEGALDQFGVPLALGAGGAYVAGALPAGVVVAGGAAVNAAAGDEQRSDALRVTGEYDAAEQARIDRLLDISGRRYGVGTAKAQETFGALISNGVDSKDAAVMTDRVIRVGKATNADPVDVAGTTVSMREIMGIPPSQMMDAYESIAIGGKMGKFEVKDMANHGPSLFAAMAGQGSTGVDGVRLTAAISQSIAAKSGSNDQAKTSFEAMLNDMVSPDVADRFRKDHGKDIYKIREEAIAAGKDPVLESLKAYHEAVGGDEQKTRSLFRNSEAYKGYAAVFGDLDLILSRMKEMEKAGGAIDKDFETNTDNFNSQKDRFTSNLGGNIKELAAPLLPILTAVARAASDQMEKARERQETDPLANVPGGSSITEGIKTWLKMTSGSSEKPSALKRFMFGAAADPEFNFKDHMGIDLRPTAEKSMGGYAEGLATEGEKATQEAQSIADRIRALLGFTVSPVISPTYTGPGAGAASPPSAAAGKQSSLSPTSNRINQTIVSPNPKHAALQANRAQERAIRQAQARSLRDTGRALA